MKTKILTLVLMFILALTTSFAQSWEGKWVQNKNYSVKISNVNNKTFDFVFACYNGRNMGEAEGKAIINGNEAIYQPDETSICQIKFILKNETLEIVDIIQNDCLPDAGNGVYYAGKYKLKTLKKKNKGQ
jgi:hypothetical protein